MQSKFHFLKICAFLVLLNCSCKEKTEHQSSKETITIIGKVYKAKPYPIIDTDSAIFYIENWTNLDSEYLGRKFKVTGELIIDSSGLKAIESYERQFDTLTNGNILFPPSQATPSSMHVLKNATWELIPE